MTAIRLQWRNGPMAIMGILNVTPDSFSDGGLYREQNAAVRYGLEMWQTGADIIDVGGESTRPGADRVDAETEMSRVVPVVRELANSGVRVSVDTTRASTAAAAIDAGASIVNDVSGGLADPNMAEVVRAADCDWILMHWRGHSRTMQQFAKYDDVVTDVCAEIRLRVDEAVKQGVPEKHLIVDPGIGFAKTAEQSWSLTARLDAVVALGLPVLFGASRKSFLRTVLPVAEPTGRPAVERDAATLATSLHALAMGAWGVRVHDVVSTIDALRVAETMRQYRPVSTDAAGHEPGTTP